MMVIKKSRDADKKNEPPAAAVVALALVFVYVLGDSYFPVDYIWYIYTFSISFVDSVDMQVFRWRPTREIRGTCSFFFFLSAPVIRVKYESRFMIFILFLLLVQLLVRIQEERLLLLLLF